MQFVENDEQNEMFDYFKTITASVPLSSNMPGRVLKILVQDKYTKTYLGLIQLSVDLLVNDEKYKFLGIDPQHCKKYKSKLRDNGANISICIPLQPFGFNFCGGKLMAMLAFSDEVYEYYSKTFDVQLKYLMTTSINGKSVQYSRLKQLKFIGYTSGYGTGHLSSDLINSMKRYLTEKNQKLNVKRMSNHTIANHVMRELHLKSNILDHGQKRGIYIGKTGKDSIDYINDKVDTKRWEPNLTESVNTIYNTWLSKYALKRKKHLIKTGRFITNKLNLPDSTGTKEQNESGNNPASFIFVLSIQFDRKYNY